MLLKIIDLGVWLPVLKRIRFPRVRILDPKSRFVATPRHWLSSPAYVYTRAQS